MDDEQCPTRHDAGREAEVEAIPLGDQRDEGEDTHDQWRADLSEDVQPDREVVVVAERRIRRRDVGPQVTQLP